MTDNEINLAVARACGYKVTVNGRGVHFVWDDDGDFIGSIGGLPLAGNTKYNPHNDDAQAIAALERINDRNGEVILLTRESGYWSAAGEHPNVKLSVVITDAILATEREKRQLTSIGVNWRPTRQS